MIKEAREDDPLGSTRSLPDVHPGRGEAADHLFISERLHKTVFEYLRHSTTPLKTVDAGDVLKAAVDMGVETKRKSDLILNRNNAKVVLINTIESDLYRKQLFVYSMSDRITDQKKGNEVVLTRSEHGADVTVEFFFDFNHTRQPRNFPKEYKGRVMEHVLSTVAVTSQHAAGDAIELCGEPTATKMIESKVNYRKSSRYKSNGLRNWSESKSFESKQTHRGDTDSAGEEIELHQLELKKSSHAGRSKLKGFKQKSEPGLNRPTNFRGSKLKGARQKSESELTKSNHSRGSKLNDSKQKSESKLKKSNNLGGSKKRTSKRLSRSELNSSNYSLESKTKS